MRVAPFLSPFLPLAALSFGLASVAGCDSGPSCAVDTDCLLGEYCSAAGQCLPLGSTGDGGGRDAGRSETGPRDAATDTRPTDAPSSDAPPADAPEDDAPAPVCPDLVGTYMVGLRTPECPTDLATMAVTGPSPSECAFEVAFDGRSAGAVAQAGASFSGTLTLAVDMPVACTITFSETMRDVLSVTCGGCMFSADGSP